MAYRLEPNRSVADNLRRIATEEIDRAIARCDDARDPEERVHDLRKRCKRLRALLRLARGELAPSGVYAAENAAFRDAADGLGGLRDRQAMIGTYDSLLDRFGAEARRAAFAPIRRSLVRKLCTESAESCEETRIAAFRARMVAAGARVADWPVAADGFAAIGDGLVRTYRRGRTAMTAAWTEPTPENFHEWRKRAKYHWYHLRLIEPAAPETLKKPRRRAKALEKLLGSHHDLAVLRADLVAASPADPPTAALLALIDRRAVELADEAETLGRKVYRRKKRRFEAEMADLWPAGNA